jgi:Tfp pilus assembly protein PilN
MINLLSPQQKEKLAEQKTLRLLVILGTSVLVFFASFLLIAVSLLIHLKGEIQAQETSMRSVELRVEQGTLQSLKDRNTAFREVAAFYKNTTTPSSLIEYIAQELPQDLFLTSLSYTPGTSTKTKGITKETRSHIILTGFASTRDSLFLFRENLHSTKVFENIVFPPSNWVNPRDIGFSVEMDVVYENK